MRPEDFRSAKDFAVARAMRNVGDPTRQLANVARPVVKYQRVRVVIEGWYASGQPVTVGDFLTLASDDARDALALGRVEPA